MNKHNLQYIKFTAENEFFPAALNPGDKIALVSPASAVKEEYVEGAVRTIKERGYNPVVMPNALHHEEGSFAASCIRRLEDLISAIHDPEIKAILCTRGGYGCVQLLPELTSTLIETHPKWIIGFSDVSALLALWQKSGVASIHGPMAKHLATMPVDDPSTEALFKILENGGRFSYSLPATSPQNHPGYASGILKGGNLAVLNSLAGTPYDLLNTDSDQDVVLFLEDINEPIYAVERMIWRLSLSGTLQKVKGIIFGQFSDYKPDKNFNSVEEMIKCRFMKLIPDDIPVVFNFPSGHTDHNLPLVEGADVDLEVTDSSVALQTVWV